MTVQRSPQQWSDVAIRNLLERASCPVCAADELFDHQCRNCGADFSGTVKNELWAASEAAAEALKARREVLDRVPRHVAAIKSRAVRPASTAKSAQPPGQRGANLGEVNTHRPQSSWAVQSVLAVAGAGLFAVSALVFTFFNPDLTDRALRSVIVGLVTIVFLGGAWLLARRSLRFSAEAVGGLGMVFVALDVYAFSELAPIGVSPWIFAATATLGGGGIMVVFSTLARIRSWLWISLLGLTLVPAMVGYAGISALSATLGYLGAAFVSLALLGIIPGLARRFDGPLRAERVTIATLQVVATVIVLAQTWFNAAHSATEYWLAITAILGGVAVLAALTTRQIARTFWSAVTGAAGMGAAVSFPFAFAWGANDAGVWYLTVIPAAAALAMLALSALAARVRTLRRRAFLGGVFTLAGASVVLPVVLAVLIGAATVLSSLSGSDRGALGLLPRHGVLAVALGLGAMSVGLGAFSAITRRTGPDPTDAAQPVAASAKLARVTGSLALWLAAIAGLTLACLPVIPVASRIAIALLLAVMMSSALVSVSRLKDSSLSTRLPLVLGSHFAVLLAIVSSLVDTVATVWAGIAIVATIAVIARAVPAPVRFLYVGAAYAYALFVFAAALDLMGVGSIAMLSLTTSLGGVIAIAATFFRRVAAGAWYAILVVTAVPFVIGVVQVVFERSGWTALSTALIFALALTLFNTRRAGVGVLLRAIAAGMLVPSLAVVVVCLGAQVLVGSASPVTLPVIAGLVAFVLPSTGLIGTALGTRNLAAREARVARIAIEVSTLLTGVISVALALARIAAGLPTTFIVLVILGLGAAATSMWAKRRYGWWLAGAAFTGALWCVWAIAGISGLEPYLLPPSLAAATLGMILTARGYRAVSLYATGLIVAVAPIIVILAVAGTGTLASGPWRGYGLIAASWFLLGLGILLGRGYTTRCASLSILKLPTLCVAIVAGSAGAIQGVRFGLGIDAISIGAVPPILLCFGLGMAGALPAAAAVRATRAPAPNMSRLAQTRWMSAPPVLYIAVATWSAIERDWFTIWAMWALMIAYLVMVIVIAWRLRIGPTSLPATWFVFTIAFVTAIVAWSPRDLRVEWFSVPLGFFLLIAGAVLLHASRARPARSRTLSNWPAGWTGSWPLLAPGIVTMLLASIAATFTDPQTWRAILVIIIALIAILIGSSRKLAAPFLIGIVVLPVENALAFLVQIGRGIESMPWWITLAVVGAVLLIIAVTYERRAGEANSITDRLLDLR